MKILIGVDDSACTHHLFERLAAHPQWLDPSHDYTALDRLPGPPQRRWAVGDPGTVLARQAAEGGFDLVMLGSHGHGALGQLVTGSTVARLLSHAKTPVLVMR
jgi:hypothetical protein